MKPRPTPQEIAKARAGVYAFLAKNPSHELRDELEVLMRATVPPTLEEAVPVIVERVNAAGKWDRDEEDEQRARDTLTTSRTLPCTQWETSVRAAWDTLRHFFGGSQ